MKTIGVDAHTITGKYQGSRTYILNILQQLGEIDPTNRYLIYSFDAAATERLLPFPNFVHRTISIRHPIPRLLFYWPYELMRQGIDLLLIQYMAPLLYPTRQMVAVHDILFEAHPEFFTTATAIRNRLLIRHSARHAAVVFALSEATRQDLVRVYGLPPEKIRLVYAGIDPARHAVPPGRTLPAELKPYILTVGRLEPRKNIGTLLRAYQRMHSRDIKLVVIGKADFRARDIMADLKATPGVVHLQDVDDQDMPLYYREASAFAFPTFAEGFGIPVLEALVQGTPVITSDHPALREAGGTLAHYFDPNQPDADQTLARLLDKVIATPPAWDPAELRRHIDQFSWRRSAERILDFVNSCPVR